MEIQNNIENILVVTVFLNGVCKCDINICDIGRTNVDV